MTPEQIAALQAENARLKADAEALRRSQAELRRAALHAENVAFAEQLGSEGRLAVAHQPVIVAALDALAGGDQPVEFGEGEARRPLAAAVRDVLAKLPQSVEFGEVATTDRAAGKASGLNNAEVARQARALRDKAEAQGTHMSYAEAVDAVTAGKSL